MERELCSAERNKANEPENLLNERMVVHDTQTHRNQEGCMLEAARRQHRKIDDVIIYSFIMLSVYSHSSKSMRIGMSPRNRCDRKRTHIRIVRRYGVTTNIEMNVNFCFYLKCVLCIGAIFRLANMHKHSHGRKYDEEILATRIRLE